MKELFLTATLVIELLAQAGPAIATTAAPAPSLPAYPGAQKMPYQMIKPFRQCGRDVMMTVYQTTASADAVEKWYSSKMPGATILKLTSSASGVTGSSLIVPGGAQGVEVSEKPSTPGAKTTITLITYNPPYGDSGVATLRAANGGDAAAQAALKHLCSSGT